MNCCGKPMWDIYHALQNRTVAYGCRYCGTVKLGPRFEDMDWARSAWSSLCAGVLRKGTVSASFKYPPPASRFVGHTGSVSQVGVEPGYKRCAMCSAVKPVEGFGLADNQPKVASRRTYRDRYKLRCLDCENRVRKSHSASEGDFEKMAEIVVPLCIKEDPSIARPTGFVVKGFVARRRAQHIEGKLYCTSCKRYQDPIKHHVIETKAGGEVQYRATCIKCTELYRERKEMRRKAKQADIEKVQKWVLNHRGK